MQDLGMLVSTPSAGRDVSINASGQVAGTVDVGSEDHAFLWSGRTTQDLGTLGGGQSFAFAINDSGQVTGGAYTTGNAEFHAVLWDGTTIQDLGTLGGGQSFAFAINASGQVTGSFITPDDIRHAFLWDGGKMVDLGALLGDFVGSHGVAINASGQVIGTLELFIVAERRPRLSVGRHHGARP